MILPNENCELNDTNRHLCWIKAKIIIVIYASDRTVVWVAPLPLRYFKRIFFMKGFIPVPKGSLYIILLTIRNLQFIIIWAYIFIVPVFHSESLWNLTQWYKPKSLIQMSCMNITCNNSIELQNTISMVFPLR